MFPATAAPPLGCTQPSDPGCTSSGDVVCWGSPPLEEAGGYLLPTLYDGSTSGSASGSSNGAGGSSGGYSGDAADAGAHAGAGAGDAAAAAAAAAALNGTQVWTLLDTELKFISLSAENSFVCGLTTAATLACWGAGLLPELVAAAAADADPAGPQQGLPGTVAELPAAAVGGGPLLKVVTGDTFACGLLQNYSLACLGGWGGGSAGLQMGEAVDGWGRGRWASGDGFVNMPVGH